MIIRDFDLQPCTMRKQDPAWRFALAASPVTEGHVLRIATQDGIEGFGYASATPHMGSTAGTLQADGYAGFGQVYETGHIREAGCWAHVRRKFYDLHVAHHSPVAQEALEQIAALYAIERDHRPYASGSLEFSVPGGEFAGAPPEALTRLARAYVRSYLRRAR